MRQGDSIILCKGGVIIFCDFCWKKKKKMKYLCDGVYIRDS